MKNLKFQHFRHRVHWVRVWCKVRILGKNSWCPLFTFCMLMHSTSILVNDGWFGFFMADFCFRLNSWDSLSKKWFVKFTCIKYWTRLIVRYYYYRAHRIRKKTRKTFAAINFLSQADKPANFCGVHFGHFHLANDTSSASF